MRDLQQNSSRPAEYDDSFAVDALDDSQLRITHSCDYARTGVDGPFPLWRVARYAQTSPIGQVYEESA